MPYVKLTPGQVGQLAKFVKEVVDRYPADDEQWEKELASLVGLKKSGVPSYQILEDDHDEILEFLINYYTTP